MVLPWSLTSLLLAAVASAAIVPSNTSTADDNFQGTLSLRSDDQSQTPIAELVPITDGAKRITINGNPLISTNYTSVGNLTNSAIAYISCNPADYPGFVDAQRVFESAYRKANLSGVILYSTATPYCDYDPGTQQLLQDFPIYSMINSQASTDLLDELNGLPVSQKFFVKIQGRGNDNSNNNNNNNNGGFQQNNPLGPSPSTAVAMIILYSITGIITALFLVIIVTGAIRAHRHPERYGPRNVLGRPRQSRARGLGRAILDTIPIVKFGEKEPPKPTDVELASTAETRDATTTTAAGDQPHPPAATTPAATAALSTPAGSQQPSSDTPVPDNHEGIAPAEPAAAVATGSKDPSSQDEGLGCSICTEDFEKGQDLRVLPCNHKFHPECVDPWLLNVSGTCPMCRVDLRPVETHDSSASQTPDEPAPSLPAEADASHRRRNAFRDILHFRTRPNATPEERIHALRRLREQRGNRSETGGDAAARNAEDVTEEGRRNKRMSARLSDVFTGRTRRERSPNQHGESSRSGAQQQQAPRDPSPSQSGTPERR